MDRRGTRTGKTPDRNLAPGSPELQRIRNEEIRTADTAASIRMFGQSQQLAKDLPPRLESGLAIWQDHMKRWRKKLNDRSG